MEIALWTLFVLIVFPAILGAALSNLSQSRSPKWLHWIFKQLGLTSVQRTAEAWSLIFGQLDRLDKGSWVRVRLKEGAGIFLGKFGRGSFAASDVRTRDLYLEQTWPVDDQGLPSTEASPNEGVWIPGEEILSVEFLGPGEEGD